MFKELESRGYKGKISLLRRYIRTIKPTPTDAVLRFETPAGKQMQVDWAKFCHRPNRISAFVATLGHSRMTYVEFVDNERLETLLVCLSNAFDYFGGVVKQILFDNMKTWWFNEMLMERDSIAFKVDYGFCETLWIYS